MLYKTRITPSEVGERVRRGRQRTAIYDAIQRDINPASETLVRTGPQPPSRPDDAINGVAENVFGTTGQSPSFLLTCSKFTLYSRAAKPTRGSSRYPSSYKCHLLYCIARPTVIQNLAHQVYQRALTLGRETRPAAPGPIPLRICTCVFTSNHNPSPWR
jgi:hypothetical protein